MRKLIAALLGAAAIAGPAFAQEQEMRPADSPDPGRVWRERAPESAPPAAEQREFRPERREAQREFRQDRREGRQEFRQDRREGRQEFRQDRREAAREFRQERGEAVQEFRQERQDDVRDSRRERREEQLERLRDRAQAGQARQEWRSDRRNRDRDWNDGRRDRDWNDGRRDRDWNDGRRDRDWNDGRQFGDWSRGWRQDRRYDWQDWRQRNRGLYRLPPYSAPRGWGFGYRRFMPGFVISPSLFARNYWILDPWEYRLPPAYGPYRWVRYWDDVLLVDLRTGRVVDVIPDFFW